MSFIKDITTKGNAKTGGWFGLIVGIILILIIIIVLWKVYSAVTTAANAFGDTLGDDIMANTYGVDASRVTICKQAAQSCVDYSHIFSLWHNHQPIIDALNTIHTDAEAKLTSVYYKQLTGDSLKDDILNSWDFFQYKSQITELLYF